MGNRSPYWEERLPISGLTQTGHHEAHLEGTLRTTDMARSAFAQFN